MTKVDFSHALSIEKIEGKLLRFSNSRLFYGDRRGLHDSCDLWVLDGRVLSPNHVFYDLKRKADFVVDCRGLILSPGFIDIQVNGAFGIDFSSTTLSSEDVEAVCTELLRYGITAFCPTVISSTPDVYKHVLPLISGQGKNSTKYAKAKILGAHLEGPFISSEKRGCHSASCLIPSFCDANNNKLSTAQARIQHAYGSLEAKSIALVTLAPELPSAVDAIEYLTGQLGVHVSIGHSRANLATGRRAIEAGATCITHLFNAMNSFHHRNGDLIALLADEIRTRCPFSYGLIADGVHNSAEALRLAHTLHPSGLILVTDCIAALGMGEGNFRLGSVEISVKGQRATIKDSQVFAGSIASMPHCIQTFMEAVNCNLDEALECATWKPARLLGVENEHGSLAPGSRADFVLLGEEAGRIRVHSVFLSGTLCYLNNDQRPF